MYGKTFINPNSSIVQASSYQTEGQQLSSLFFRVLFNAIKRVNLDLAITPQNNIENHWLSAINKAKQNSTVSLAFLDQFIQKSSPQNSIKQFIQSLPQPIMQQIFAQQFTCQCGYYEEIVSLLPVSRMCKNCSSKMQIQKAPVITFSGPQHSIKSTFQSTNFYLNAMLTSKNSAILVDFDKISKGNSDEIFVLETMPEHKISETYRDKISQLTYLKKQKSLDYVKNRNKQIQDLVGEKVLQIWFNQNYLEADLQQKLNVMESGNVIYEEPLMVQQSYSLDEETPLTKEKPTQEFQISTIKINDYTWCIYFALALLFIGFLICIITLSVLIFRMNNTFTANNLIVKNKSYIGLPQVQTPSDITNFQNSITAPVAAPQSLPQITRKTALTTASLYAGTLIFSEVQITTASFKSVNLPNLCATANIGTTPLILTNLNVKTLNAANFSTVNLQQNGLIQNDKNAADLTVQQVSVQQTYTTSVFSTISPISAQSARVGGNGVNVQNTAVIGQLVNSGQTQCTNLISAVGNTPEVTTASFSPKVNFPINQPTTLPFLTLQHSNMVGTGSIQFPGAVAGGAVPAVNFHSTSTLKFNGNVINYGDLRVAGDIYSLSQFDAQNPLFQALEFLQPLNLEGPLTVSDLTVLTNSTIQNLQINALECKNITSFAAQIANSKFNSVNSVFGSGLEVGLLNVAAGPVYTCTGCLSISSNAILTPNPLIFTGQWLNLNGKVIFQDITSSLLSGNLTTTTGVLSQLTSTNITNSGTVTKLTNLNVNNQIQPASIISSSIGLQLSNSTLVQFASFGQITEPAGIKTGVVISGNLINSAGNLCTTSGKVIQQPR